MKHPRITLRCARVVGVTSPSLGPSATPDLQTTPQRIRGHRHSAAARESVTLVSGTIIDIWSGSLSPLYGRSSGSPDPPASAQFRASSTPRHHAASREWRGTPRFPFPSTRCQNPASVRSRAPWLEHGCFRRACGGRGHLTGPTVDIGPGARQEWTNQCRFGLPVHQFAEWGRRCSQAAAHDPHAAVRGNGAWRRWFVTIEAPTL